MRLSLLAVVAVMTASASAASYFFNNGSGSTASGITDSLGGTFQNGTTPGAAFATGGGISAGPGVVGVGIFSTDNLVGLNAAALISDFTRISDGASPFASAGPVGSRGVFSCFASNVTISGSVFENRDMYLFAGNGTTYANSTQFLVVKLATQFLGSDDDIVTVTTEIFRPSGGTAATTLLVGTNVANIQTANTDASTTPGWAMVTVPESSTALLGAFGALALLRRRRA